VDFGSGAGYFALKMARRVDPGGRVLAVDLRRQSLAFLWIRATLDGLSSVHVIRGAADDPRLPAGSIDAVLIANTLHELTAPEPILAALSRSMRSGGRLVVVDHAARGDESGHSAASGHHDLTAAEAERAITKHGFRVVGRQDRLIDRQDDNHVWWLIAFQKP
jgi:ubiquinone/menaquinone biosynthesis C-methylase UbiE